MKSTFPLLITFLLLSLGLHAQVSWYNNDGTLRMWRQFKIDPALVEVSNTISREATPILLENMETPLQALEMKVSGAGIVEITYEKNKSFDANATFASYGYLKRMFLKSSYSAADTIKDIFERYNIEGPIKIYIPFSLIMADNRGVLGESELKRYATDFSVQKTHSLAPTIVSGIKAMPRFRQFGKYFTLNTFFGMDRLAPNSDMTVHMPSSLRASRAQNFENPSDFEEFGDYPQRHFSFFGGLQAITHVHEGYDLNLQLIGENRSASFGVLKRNNFVLFPRIFLDARDDFRIAGREFSFKAKVGDMVQFDLRNRLGIYNLDAQGGDIQLNMGRLFLGFTSIADLSQHIGLRIQEVFSYRGGMEDIRLSDNYSLKVGLAGDFFIGLPEGSNFIIPHLYFNIDRFDGDLSFYGEAGYRYFNEGYFTGIQFVEPDLAQSTAAILGASYNFKKVAGLRLNHRLEGRYYGQSYNYNRFSIVPDYKENADNTGRYLYPLINAYRPFDQWAVYTEYQNQDIIALSWASTNEWYFTRMFSTYYNQEVNLIKASEEDAFTYYFYEFGLKFSPVEKFEIMLYLSNKVMNIDMSYQTFYQANAPMIGYSLRQTL